GLPPARSGFVQVDHLCGPRSTLRASTIRFAAASDHDQHVSIVVHDRRSPIANAPVAIREKAPSSGARDIKVAGCRIWTGNKHFPVWSDMHKGIEWYSQMRGA